MHDHSMRRAAKPGRLLFVLAFSLALAEPAIAQSLPSSRAELDIAGSFRLALQSSPRLAAAEHSVAASQADARQASRWGNPDVSLDVENFGSSGTGIDQAETTLSISQQIPLGGRVRHARRVADATTEASVIQRQRALTDVLAETATQYVQVVAARQQEEFLAEIVAINEEMAIATEQKIQAGRSSPIELPRVQANLAIAQTELAISRLSRIAQTERLALLLGQELSVNTVLLPPTILETQDIREAFDPAAIDQNFDIRLSRAETYIRSAEISRARAEGMPDVTLGVGVRRLAGGDDTALVATASMPIPITNRNQDAVAAAVQRETVARLSVEDIRLQQMAALTAAYNNWVAARRTVDSIRQQILPLATNSFESAQFAHREGQIDLINYLDAQRQLFDARNAAIEAETRLRLATIEIDVLTGGLRLRAIAGLTQEDIQP